MSLKTLLHYFKPDPFIEPISDKKVVDREYVRWRWRIFYSMFFGYMFYYFTRKGFVFAMPGMIEELGYERAQLGILGSVLSISYGASKFVSGMIGDRSNPRFMMAAGLIITGLLNIFFGLSSSLVFFVLFTLLNGLFQGFGWPPCARYLTHWYSHNERGTWWSCWNISHNLGGALIPIIVATVSISLGWRFGLFIPGVVCIAAGLMLLNRLRDTPQSLGLPSVEEWRNDYGGADRVKSGDERELSTREGLVDYVLKNPFIWLLAFAYLFIYVTREAFNYWTQLFLIQEKSYDALGASYAIVFFEGGGVVGSLFAGWFSDRYTNGRRGPVNVIYSAALLGATALFWFVPHGFPFLDYMSVFLIGFFVFGPQMLIGLAAAEIAHKKAAATATGFLGFVAYLGAALSGYPLGKITDHWGWEGFFITAGVCCICATLLLIPTWGVTARRSKELQNETA